MKFIEMRGSQLMHLLSPDEIKPEELRKAGATPEQLAAEMAKYQDVFGMSPEQRARKIAAPYSDDDLYGDPRFLLLDKPTADGMPRYVVVFADKSMGVTGFVIHVRPQAVAR